MNILAFTVTRVDSPQRAKLLASTIEGARQTAGLDFIWHIWAFDNEFSRDALRDFEHVHYTVENEGQHIAFNKAHDLAIEMGMDYLLRLDDDVEFKSKRWLKKLVETSQKLDDKCILSPVIMGLSRPPARTYPTIANGVALEFLHSAIGGICRLHPMKLIDGYISDVRLPLGSGDATGIAKWCQSKDISMAYVRHIRVKHAKTTIGQELDDPNYFKVHGVFQCIPFIPIKSISSSTTMMEKRANGLK